MEHIHAALQKAKQQRGSDPANDQTTTTVARMGSDMLWASLPSLKPDPKHLAKTRLVTINRSDLAHTQFDMLRTKVLQYLRQNNWTSVAITSPTPACGKTVVGLNLAFSMAHHKECRTVLIDLDLRRPQVSKVLGIKEPPSIESFLRGRSEVEDVFIRYGDNIAIGANGRPVRFAAELLQSPEAAQALKSLKQKLKPDVLIFDLPPMLANDDVMAFLPNVDCVILVAAAEASTFSEVDICERDLSEKSKVLGVVLNKCRYAPEKYGY
ncbi:CpsD/CapB family tyrosine-protein kinase [Mesorhizobium sp. DCY119]|uniref:CpsD/CapB family tyrosine-protein kinase n=1 Tax=Mesorhizobium sp. DCY119 TaxID=2108445 RepID=UPI000E6B85C8|nr:CpsD/CapB family tyrosine-protein kinase [Mesorhizobium sp. DCY119]RJG43351.1 chromosome partitioning protein [Mesorhizobium sp. DCY119]